MNANFSPHWPWLAGPGLAIGLLITAGCGSTVSESADIEPVEGATAAPSTSSGSGGDNSAATDDDLQASAETVEPGPTENLFPDVDVVDLATGDDYNLTNLGSIDKPVLLWFWAPH